jgi:hypothetical protein
LVKDRDKALMSPNTMHLILQRLLTGTLLVSAVGFAASPMAPGNGTTPTKFVTTGLGKSVRIGTVTITPISVLEDSRCPANVQCIQAGTVRIAARLRMNGKSETATLGFLMPHQLRDRWIHLVAACPNPMHPVTIAPVDYRFTFVLEPNAIAPPYKGNCNSPK